MILSPYTYDDHSINDGTNYSSYFPKETPLTPFTDTTFIQRAGAFPIYAGKTFAPATITLGIQVQSSINANLEQINEWFDITNETPKQLIIKDTAQSNKQYYIYVIPKFVSQLNGENTVFVTLAIVDPIWTSVSQTTQNWNVTTDSSSFTTDIVIPDNAEVYPKFEITPTSVKSGGWFYKREIQVRPYSVNGWTNRPVDLFETTDGTGLDTAALIAAGKMQASSDPAGAGGDIRIYIDGVQSDYWLTTDINTTDTSCWTNLTIPPASEMSLKTAIASTDTVTEIEFKYTNPNSKALNRMPTRGRVVINSEEFSYGSKTISSTKLSVGDVTRSVRNTSAGTHAVGDTCWYMPYAITLLHGNLTADAQTMDNTVKPVIDLDTSSNSSFVYSNFSDGQKLRSGIWQQIKLSNIPNLARDYIRFYTGTQVTNANPAQVTGMQIGAYKEAGIWKSITADLSWLAPFPDGITTIGASGEKYHTSDTFPTGYLQTSSDGSKWNTVYSSTAVPSSDYGAWTSWTLTSSDYPISTTDQIFARWRMNGTVKSSANNLTRFAATATTVGLGDYPQFSTRSEEGLYNLDIRISTTDGNYMDISYPMKTTETLYIDTNPEFPTATFAGQYVPGAVKINSVRSRWMPLAPGTNTLTFAETNNGAITIAVRWRDRMIWL